MPCELTHLGQWEGCLWDRIPFVHSQRFTHNFGNTQEKGAMMKIKEISALQDEHLAELRRLYPNDNIQKNQVFGNLSYTEWENLRTRYPETGLIPIFLFGVS